MRPETLFLDAGGVLLEPDWSRLAALLARHGIAVDAARLEEMEPLAKREMDLEHVIKATSDASRAWIYYELVMQRAGVVLPSAAATSALWQAVGAEHARRNFWERVPAGVPEALARLRASGLRMAVVSNSNGTVRALLTEAGLAPYFDAVIDSTEERVEKPDPRIFAIALARTAARPETTVHVGDLYNVDVVGARAAGIEGWLIDPRDLYADADCPRVRSLGDLADVLTRSRSGSAS